MFFCLSETQYACTCAHTTSSMRSVCWINANQSTPCSLQTWPSSPPLAIVPWPPAPSFPCVREPKWLALWTQPEAPRKKYKLTWWKGVLRPISCHTIFHPIIAHKPIRNTCSKSVMGNHGDIFWEMVSMICSPKNCQLLVLTSVWTHFLECFHQSNL